MEKPSRCSKSLDVRLCTPDGWPRLGRDGGRSTDDALVHDVYIRYTLRTTSGRCWVLRSMDSKSPEAFPSTCGWSSASREYQQVGQEKNRVSSGITASNGAMRCCCTVGNTAVSRGQVTMFGFGGFLVIFRIPVGRNAEWVFLEPH